MSISNPPTLKQQALWILLYGASIVGMGVLRFVIYHDDVVPLTYGLPLLLCLISRDLRALYPLAWILTAMALAKAALLHFGLGAERVDSVVFLAMQWINIWIITWAIRVILGDWKRLEQKNEQLAITNDELEASNEELTAREEEITRQNEELQSQAEELEQQAEELRQQSGDIEVQSAELQDINAELKRRESGLQALLTSTRWVRSGLAQSDVFDAVCGVARQLMGDVATAAIAEIVGNHLRRRALDPALVSTAPEALANTFEAIVAETRQPAYIQDITSRPDLTFPGTPTRCPFRSVLGAPVLLDDRVVAVITFYAREPHDWTAEEFRVATWMASQISLAMQSVAYQRHLQEEKRKAESDNRRKSQFLAAVSHDVRTPANAISLLADVVEEEVAAINGNSNIPATVRALKNNARSLVDLVTNVLDLARIDSTTQQLEVSVFSACGLLGVEVRQQLAQASAKNLRLECRVPPVDIWLRTDKMKLARAVSNLLGNAIKFTEVGEVIVSCQQVPSGEVEITVADTGVGVAPEEYNRIFDEFYQIQNPERDRNKGSGLGLSICRRLLEELGCRITVVSALGKGSTFTIHIPADLVTPGPAMTNADPIASARHQQLEDLRILLVEDHAQTRRAAAHLLSARGARVFQAGDGRSALQLLAHEHPNVLLLDLMLPDMDGCDVLRHLSTIDHGLQCVLVVSGDVREERREEVRRLGAHDLVGKPLSIDVLTTVIRRELRDKVRCAD